MEEVPKKKSDVFKKQIIVLLFAVKAKMLLQAFLFYNWAKLISAA